jgi:NAD(P)-dependent dehydrogenase (short-subunit alcohol dehydrogenase family)
MRILLVGATGTIGSAVQRELGPRHEIIKAGRSSGDVIVDLMSTDSIRAMYAQVGKVDAVIATAGHAHFGPLVSMTNDQFMVGLNDKLMGQVNLVLLGIEHVNDAGSFTLTSGMLDRDPVRLGANAATVNAAIGGFVGAACLEMPRGIRINVVSPGVLEESAAKYAGFFAGHIPVSSKHVGMAFAKSVEGALTGRVMIVE